MRKLIVGMSGASGALLGIRLLEALRALNVETHLVMTKWAEATIHLETPYTLREVRNLASVVHTDDNQAASIASGSFPIDGMIVAPCSMKTLAHIRHGFADDLLRRAADVTLKERRKLVLLARETPLSAIHLENMLHLTHMGAIILPPVLTFYAKAQTLDQHIDHLLMRTLDQFGLHLPLAGRWEGVNKRGQTDPEATSSETTSHDASAHLAIPRQSERQE